MKILKPESKAFKMYVIYVAVLFGILFLMLDRVAETKLEKEKIAENYERYFKYLPIEAKAVYIYDLSTKKPIYYFNSSKPLPLASITKVMNAICALDDLGRNTNVTIDKSDLDTEGNSSLKAGEVWTVKDLVSYTLVESSNDGATALARADGGAPNMITCMNRKAESLGLFETKFANVTGLDMGDSPGAYGSAEDAVKLFVFASENYPDIFETTGRPKYNVVSESGMLHVATNTDRAIKDIYGFIASKTGYTDLAGGNLVFLMDAGLGHKVAISLLGSSEEGRFLDASMLSEATLRAITNEK